MADKSNAEVAPQLVDAGHDLIAELTMLPDVTIVPCCESDALRKIVDALATAQSSLAKEVLEHIEVERLRKDAPDSRAYNQAVDDALTSVKRLFTRLGIKVEEVGNE